MFVELGFAEGGINPDEELVCVEHSVDQGVRTQAVHHSVVFGIEGGVHVVL